MSEMQVSEKQEQERAAQVEAMRAAVDYVATLVAQNGARVVNASARGLVFELEGARWEVEIERNRSESITVPYSRGVCVVVSKPEFLRDVVQGGLQDSDEAVQRQDIQSYRWHYHGSDWIFEIIADRGRLRVGGEASDNSLLAVSVEREKYPSMEDARAAAETTVELCNAFVAREVFRVYLIERSADGQSRFLRERYHEVFGVSHLLAIMIEMLTKRNLVRPGYGLLHVMRVEFEIETRM